MSSIKNFLRSLLELIEDVYENSRRSGRKRTWHQHVVPYGGIWAIRREGNKRITSKHRKQSTAIRKAKSIARKHKADVIIHRADGGIRERLSYD